MLKTSQFKAKGGPIQKNQIWGGGNPHQNGRVFTGKTLSIKFQGACSGTTHEPAIYHVLKVVVTPLRSHHPTRAPRDPESQAERGDVPKRAKKSVGLG